MGTAEHLRVTLNWDWCHRICNDWSLALNHSGLQLCRLEYKLVTCGKFGPFGGSKNHWLIKGASNDFFTKFDHRSWLWQIIYDRICIADPGLCRHPEFGQESHEKIVFEECRESLSGSTMDGPTQLGRWWNMEHKSMAIGRQRFHLLLALTHLGFQQKWWSGAAECPLFSKSTRYLANEGEHVDIEQETCIGEHAGEQLEEAPAPGVSALETTTVSRARDTAASRRVKNILQEMTHLLADDVGVYLWQGLSHMIAPVEKAFSEELKRMRSLEGIAVTVRGFSDQSLLRRMIADVLEWFGSPEYAGACLPGGDDNGEYTEHQQGQVAVVGSHLAQCLWKLVTELHVSALMFSQPPLQFVQLIDTDDSVVMRCLEEMRREFEWLERLEGSLDGGQHADESRQLYNSLLAPHLQWHREVWLKCWECDWQAVPEDLKHQLQCYLRSHHSTLLVENSFNACRAHGKKSKTHREAGPALWNLSCYGRTSSDFGRPVERHTSVDQAVNLRQLPHGLFTQGTCEASLTEGSMERLTQKKADWPLHTPTSLKQAAVAWELLKHKQGRISEMKDAWLSLLLEPGTLILDTKSKDKGARLVTGVTQHGYFWIKPSINVKNKHVLFDDQSHKLHFDVLERPDDWKVAEMTLLPPKRSGCGSTESSRNGMTFEIDRKHITIRVPQYAGSFGFRHCTCYYLKKLRKWYGVTSACNNTEKALVTSLLGHLCKSSYGESFVTKSLTARKITGAEVPLKTSRVMNMPKETVAEAFHEDPDDDEPDLEAIHEWEQLKQQRESINMDAKELAAHMQEWLTLRPLSTSCSSAGTAEGVEKGKRKFLPKQTSGYEPDDVKEWLPAGATMTKDKRENRWRLRCKHLPGSGDKSKSYGGRHGLSDFDAMRLLVLSAWSAATAATGIEMPFELEEMPLPQEPA
eukprot:1151245-Amphidinium_carterae.1